MIKKGGPMINRRKKFLEEIDRKMENLSLSELKVICKQLLVINLDNGELLAIERERMATLQLNLYDVFDFGPGDETIQ